MHNIRVSLLSILYLLREKWPSMVLMTSLPSVLAKFSKIPYSHIADSRLLISDCRGFYMKGRSTAVFSMVGVDIPHHASDIFWRQVRVSLGLQSNIPGFTRKKWTGKTTARAVGLTK